MKLTVKELSGKKLVLEVEPTLTVCVAGCVGVWVCVWLLLPKYHPLSARAAHT
jgi:hypothetical protein